MTRKNKKNGLAGELRAGSNQKSHSGIAQVALRLKPRCIVVESIVLRLFKKLPKNRVFQQFFAFFQGIDPEKLPPEPEKENARYFAPETLGCS